MTTIDMITLKNKNNSFLLAGFAICLSSLLIAAGCSNKDASNNNTEKDSRHDYLQSLADNVVTPQLATLQTTVNELSTLVSDADLNIYDSVVANKVNDTFISFQGLAPMQIGPLGDEGTFTAGANLGASLYSGFGQNLCIVTKAILNETYVNEGFTRAEQYGFDALYHLIKNEDKATTGCAAFEDLTRTTGNSTGNNDSAETWDSLSQLEVDARKSEYIKVVVAKLKNDITSANNLWADFSDELSNAGSGSAIFSSVQDALDEWYRAYFYSELQIKDRKLGNPTGQRLVQGCNDTNMEDTSITCPAFAELYNYDISDLALKANIDGMTRIYFGGNTDAQFGIDDLLIELGASTLASSMTAQLDTLMTSSSVLDAPIETIVVDAVKLENVVNYYDELRGYTGFLRDELKTVLNLSENLQPATDND